MRERVKIYATDVDEEALAQARQARYSPKQVEGVPPELLECYFERNGDDYVFSKDLRRSVIFGRHDLIQDAPISRIDLLVCRNTLMYLNSETQAQVLARFSFALREGGYLLLGKAEMLLAHSNLFTAVDLKRRVFRKVPGATLRERLMVLADAGERPAGTPARARGPDPRRRPGRQPGGPDRGGRGRLSDHGQRTGADPLPAQRRRPRPGRSRTWSSPTGRWSCAPRSSRSTSSGGRPRSTRSSGRRPRARSPTWRCRSSR